MLAAEPAVIGTAALGEGAEVGGHLAGEAEFHAIVLANVGTDEIFACPMRRALLPEINPSLPFDDLGGHQRQALGTKALGHAQEGVFAEAHGSAPSRPEPVKPAR